MLRLFSPAECSRHVGIGEQYGSSSSRRLTTVAIGSHERRFVRLCKGAANTERIVERNKSDSISVAAIACETYTTNKLHIYCYIIHYLINDDDDNHNDDDDDDDSSEEFVFG
jgi:hypothetical protein